MRALVVASLLVTTAVHAQDDPVDLARGLFMTGVDQFEAGDMAAAIASFSQALELHDAPTIRYNLASAYAESHQHVAAYRLVVALQADATLEPDLRTDVNALEARVRLHVGRIDLNGSPDLELRLDGEPVETGLVIVDPGPHGLEGMRGEQVAVRRSVTIAGGERVAVDLTVATVETVAVETPEDPIPVVTRDRAPLRRGIGIAAGGAVLIAIVVVAVIATRPPDPVNGTLEPGTFRW